MNIVLNYEDRHNTLPQEKKIYVFLKRTMDIILSLSGIILLFPFFLIVSMIIVLDSPGPVIFKQIRCGKDGKEFKMFKFRSMVHNAENLLSEVWVYNNQSGPIFKMKEDPRVTRVGRFMRRTSIDELPQLFNVLAGDMSIVGPRPPIPYEVSNYSPYEMQRLSVKPGMTCYWQVMGRNSVSFNRWVELDIKYIKDRNLRVDIMLILKTFRVLFGDRNAW